MLAPRLHHILIYVWSNHALSAAKLKSIYIDAPRVAITCCCWYSLSISQDTRVLNTALSMAWQWDSWMAIAGKYTAGTRQHLEISCAASPQELWEVWYLLRRWRGLWKAMNPKLILDKDVSNLLTWKYSLSNKRPLIVCVYFVALKTAHGQARQSKADE